MPNFGSASASHRKSGMWFYVRHDRAAMVGGFTAPAKRMAFFIHRNTDYSPDGIKLFDAAVDYLLAP